MRVFYASLILVALARFEATSQSIAIDFRYSPAYSFSAICFPDDWQKTVLMNIGALGYDFGPGPYARPMTEITVTVKDCPLKLVKQFFPDPQVPVAVTRFSSDRIEVAQEIFSCVPEASSPVRSRFHAGKTEIERIGGLTGCLGWTTPPDSVDPGFRSVAWGTNRPITYRIRVTPHSSHLVALGLCESYKPKTGTRVLDLRVEGAPTQTVDALKDGMKNVPHVYLFSGRDVDGDGWLNIESHASVSCPDPNTILNVMWMFPLGTTIDTVKLVSGRLNDRAEAYWACGSESELQGPTPRRDILRARFAGDKATPIVHVSTSRRLAHDEQGHTLTWQGRTFVSALPSPETIRRTDTGWDLEFAEGTQDLAVMITNGIGATHQVRSLKQVDAERRKTERVWKESLLPFGRITLPDTTLQYLLEASVRNLYQIREDIDGVPTFQPGPSVYRGLWLHDAVWHTAAVTMLGDTAGARRALEGLLRFQEPDGRIRLMVPFPINRETPLVVHAMWRYARLTQNARWLDQRWPSLSRAINWLWNFRNTTLKDPTSIGYGLFPPGFSDGGLAGVNPEYGSAYWALIGLRSAIDAARWLNKEADAELWQNYYRELLQSFRGAAARDMRRDRFGNIYLPMKVGDTSQTTPPQQANWGIIEAQAYVRLFDAHDSLLTGSLAMLQGEVKEGLAVSTGWLKDGLWPFFSMIQALAHIEQREYQVAGDLLTSIANHASTTGTWIEEQLPRNLGTRTGGDASNASASSLFIQLVRSMILLERDSTIDLLAGIPTDWYAPGAVLEVTDLPTMFGRCSLRAEVSRTGSEAQIRVGAIGKKEQQGGPTLFLDGFRKKGFRMAGGKEIPDQVRGKWGEEMVIHLSR